MGFNTTIATPSQVTSARVDSAPPTTAAFGTTNENNAQAQGGNFDFSYEFLNTTNTTQNFGNASGPLVFTLSWSISGTAQNLNPEHFLAVSADGGTTFGTGGYYMAALVQKGGTSAAQSGSIGDNNGTSAVTPIPEPEIYAMLAAGLGLMGYVARRRRQQSVA
jgi:hypothetical protein